MIDCMPAPSNIRKVLLPRFDTLGDIILLQAFVSELSRWVPQAELTLLVRAGYESELAPLYNIPQLRWKTHPFNPYSPHTENPQQVLSFLDEIADEQWDVVFFTTYNRTPLEDILAAKLQGPFRIAVDRDKKDQVWATRSLSQFGLSSLPQYDLLVSVDEKANEIEKYRVLFEALNPSWASQPIIPSLSLPDDALLLAQRFLSQQKLRQCDYFVCMPAGLMTIKIKAWPSANFAAVSKWAAQELHIQPLVVGHVSEKEIVERTVDQMRAAGVEPHIWLGQGGDLQVLAALLKTARFYVGNDSAPMHLSAAVGTPTVGIFGGGHWPRFLPAGEKAIGVAAPLPCFYCSWDCIFGDAPCVRLVSVKDVIRAINIVLSDGPETHGNMLLASITADPATSELVEKSKGVVQQLRADLRLCREVIDSLKEQISKESAEHLEIVTKIDNSLSWRVTRPLRLLGRVFRKRR